VSGGGARSFRRDELLGAEGHTPDRAELDVVAAIALELERVAREPAPRPSRDFADRVSRAIAAEPLPVPSIAVRESLRHGNAGGFMHALADTLRVAFGPARPAVMRSQAFALLLVVVIGVSALGGATAFAASRFVIQPAPVTGTPTASATQSPTPTATASLEDGSPTPEASESENPSASEPAGETPDATKPAAGSTDSHAGSSPTPSPESASTSTPRPTRTPENETPHPSATATPGS
jgi:hypothetical protein